MKHMHNLLKRQLVKYFGNSKSISEEWQDFIDIVNETYHQSDSDRNMLKRSLDLSSQELLHANAEMRAVFQAFPDLFFWLDSNGKIINYKGGGIKDLYLAPEKLIGKKIQNIPVKSVAKKIKNALDLLQETKSMVSLEYSLVMGESAHYYEARLLPLFEDQIIMIVRNITERKRMEAEKEKLQAELIHTQKMESIGRLAGGIAHDFNNILCAINGYSALIAMKMGNDNPLKNEIDLICKAGKSAAALVQQLLAFSHKQIIKPEILSLNSIIKNIQKMLRRIIGENIKIKVILEKKLGNIKADHSQIMQVIINLIVNANDAMPKGGKLKIETKNFVVKEEYTEKHTYAKPGEYIMLLICDTGHGISEEEKKHIFEPFFTTKDKEKGTGLGLATVYGIVKRYQGFIELESEYGKGTTFIVCLPRIEEKVQKNKRESLVQMPTGSETVLVVEDENEVRNFVIRVLTELGYTVLEAKDGKDAVKKVGKYSNNVHMLLTDVVMPNLSGYELSQRIKNKFPKIKILYMSGHTDKAIVSQGILKKGVNFLQKPITPQILAQTVRKVFDR